MRRVVGAMACGAALVVSGCGGSGAGTSASSPASASASSASVSSSASSSATSPAGRARRHHRSHLLRKHDRGSRPIGPPVGTTQRVHAGATTLAVTVTRVIDPLSGSAGPPGTRPVGVRITIVNHGGGTYDSTASGDVSLRLSGGAAAPLYIKSGPCQTPLTDFESLIGAGETRSGCVGFSVPRRSRIVGVRFSPRSRPPGTVTWRR